jgi:hypothetical protein
MSTASDVLAASAAMNESPASTINHQYHHRLTAIEDMRYDGTPLKFYHFLDQSKLGYSFETKEYFEVK